MAETTTPPRRRDHVEPAPLSEYELQRNKKIAANQAFLETLGLGGTGQKLPKKPARAKPKKRKREEQEQRKSVRLAGGPAPIERLQDDPRSYLDFVESRERRKRARRQEPWEPTDEQRERLGEFFVEEFYDFLGTTTKYHKEISPDNRKTVIRQVTTVWKSKFYDAFVLNRRVDLHAIDATPARLRCGAGSSQLDGASMTASSPKNDTLVDFHTGNEARDGRRR